MNFLDLIFRQNMLDGVTAVVVDAGIPRDVKHPCLELPVATKCISVFQDSKEDILYEIVSDHPVVGHSDEVVEQDAMVPVEQDAEFGDFSGPNGHHQVL